MKNRIAIALACCICWLPATAARAQTDPANFPLSKAIPDDVFIAVSAKANPERKFLDNYWAEVIEAFTASGVMTDVWDMITDSVPDENLDEIEDTMDRFSELAGKIEWSHMFDKEFVYCGRFNPAGTPAMHEGMFIGRSDREKAEANYAGLKKLLAELVKLVNEKAGQSVVNLDETKGEGAKIASLTFPGAPGIAISVAHTDDVIFLSFGGSTILSDGLKLYQGEGPKKGIVATARFKQAFDQLPPAEDSMVFFDVESMMGTFRTMAGAFSAEDFPGAGSKQGKSETKDESDEPDTSGEGDDEPEPAQEPNPMKILSQLLQDVSIVDYVAETEWTDGYRVFTDSVTVLKANAKYSPLYDVLTSGKPTSNFEKFIPKEAVSFSVSSGINLTKLYQYVINFVKKNAPEGEQLIEHWNEVQANHLQLDVEKDVLGLFEGSMGSYAAGNDWVMMFKLTDQEKMDKQITRLLTHVNELMKDSPLIITKVKVNEKTEFKQIGHAMMAMMPGISPPVVGCSEGQLFIGSSAKTIKTCLMTAAGKHDNITKNKRWQDEAIMPTGSVVGVSFTDESNMGQELQQAIAGISMGVNMMGMFMADAPPEAKKMLSAAGQILSKLGPVAGRLDFYKSSAATESFDGKRWLSHSVQNYKKQSERPAREDESEGEGIEAPEGGTETETGGESDEE